MRPAQQRSGVPAGALASQALEQRERQAITVLPVVDEARKVLEIVHRHDLPGRGDFKFR